MIIWRLIRSYIIDYYHIFKVVCWLFIMGVDVVVDVDVAMAFYNPGL